MQNGIKRLSGRRQFGRKRRIGKESRKRGSRKLNGATSSCNCPCQQSPSKRKFAEKVEEFILNKQKEATEAKKIFYEVAHRMLTIDNSDNTNFGANAIDE